MNIDEKTKKEYLNMLKENCPELSGDACEIEVMRVRTYRRR